MSQYSDSEFSQITIMNWLHKKATEFKNRHNGDYEHFLSSEDEGNQSDENDNELYNKYYKSEDR
jgi:hypothetical protein